MQYFAGNALVGTADTTDVVVNISNRQCFAPRHAFLVTTESAHTLRYSEVIRVDGLSLSRGSAP